MNAVRAMLGLEPLPCGRRSSEIFSPTKSAVHSWDVRTLTWRNTSEVWVQDLP